MAATQPIIFSPSTNVNGFDQTLGLSFKGKSFLFLSTITAKIECGLARIRPLSHSFFITGNFGEEIIFFYDPHVVGILSFSFHHDIGCCLLDSVSISSLLAFVWVIVSVVIICLLL